MARAEGAGKSTTSLRLSGPEQYGFFGLSKETILILLSNGISEDRHFPTVKTPPHANGALPSSRHPRAEALRGTVFRVPGHPPPPSRPGSQAAGLRF